MNGELLWPSSYSCINPLRLYQLFPGSWRYGSNDAFRNDLKFRNLIFQRYLVFCLPCWYKQIILYNIHTYTSNLYFYQKNYIILNLIYFFGAASIKTTINLNSILLKHKQSMVFIGMVDQRATFTFCVYFCSSLVDNDDFWRRRFWIRKECLLAICFWKCNFPMNNHVRLFVGLLVGRLVGPCRSVLKGRKLHFIAPVGALVSFFANMKFIVT